MSFDPYIAEVRARQRRDELLRDAAETRLPEALDGRRRERAYCRALAWFGGRLIAWGWRLRARYGSLEHEHAL